MLQPPFPYGQLVTITVTAPAAGNNFDFAVPGKSHCRILSVDFTLTAAVAAANRYARLVANDTTQIFCTISPGTLQTASQVVDYHFSIGTSITSVAPGTVNIQAFAPLPDHLVLRGQGGLSDLLSSNVQNLQAADQLANIIIRYEQWTQADLT